MGALDLFGGLVTLCGLHAVAEAAHIDLGCRGALAGVEIFGAEDDVELTLDFDDIAFAKRTGDDFHGHSSMMDPGTGFLRVISARNIPILRLKASVSAVFGAL
jgi:hypothetical protein